MNSVEWTQAQGLLKKFIDALSPLTVQAAVSSDFLNRRFFVPPHLASNDYFQRHPVRLLLVLREVEKEVGEWIGKTEKKTESKPTKVENKPSSKEPIPIGKQAKELIRQVQEAIGKLSNSRYIQNPQEAPLRKVLVKLKPDLERIIDAVSELLESQGEIPKKAPLRRAVPVSTRQERLEKLLFSTKDTPFPDAAPTKRTDRKVFSTPKEKPTLSVKRVPEKGEKIPEKAKKEEAPLSSQLFPRIEKREEGLLRKEEMHPVALPILGAPVPKKTLLPRKKKKRKGFWSKEEEKDPSP